VGRNQWAKAGGIGANSSVVLGSRATLPLRKRYKGRRLRVKKITMKDMKCKKEGIDKMNYEIKVERAVITMKWTTLHALHVLHGLSASSVKSVVH